MINYYNEIPIGYKVFKVIDAKNKKTIKWFNLISSFVFVFSIFPFVIIKPPDFLNVDSIFPFVLVTIVGVFAYIVLHELTHGIFYSLYTKQKLTFGFTKSVAFCGIPHIYITKKVSLIAGLAPFVVFNILLIPTLVLMPANDIYFALVLIFSFHFSGCIGDLYASYILLKSKSNILVNDTGPKMTFYKLEDNSSL
jgi:hypothetical protein